MLKLQTLGHSLLVGWKVRHDAMAPREGVEVGRDKGLLASVRNALPCRPPFSSDLCARASYGVRVYGQPGHLAQVLIRQSADYENMTTPTVATVSGRPGQDHGLVATAGSSYFLAAPLQGSSYLAKIGAR